MPGKPGRPLGSKNKVSASARENVIAVFTRLGGTAAMAKWAAHNKDEFYKLYARLLPIEHSGVGGGPIEHRATVRLEVNFKSPLPPREQR
jgi:hypothetical protein